MHAVNFDRHTQSLSAATNSNFVNFFTARAVKIASFTYTITGGGEEIALVRRQHALGRQRREDRDAVSCASGESQ